jgi:hypothetical protein
MVENAVWNLIFQTAFQKTFEISNDLLAALSHIREDQQRERHTPACGHVYHDIARVD